jgi:hypothetical protein
MKAVWYTYRIKADATEGTSKIDAALKTTGHEFEFLRATPAKEKA